VKLLIFCQFSFSSFGRPHRIDVVKFEDFDSTLLLVSKRWHTANNAGNYLIMRKAAVASTLAFPEAEINALQHGRSPQRFDSCSRDTVAAVQDQICRNLPRIDLTQQNLQRLIRKSFLYLLLEPTEVERCP